MNLSFADTEALAAEVARCELAPSQRALFHTVRFWNGVCVIALSIAFVLACVLALSTAVLAVILGGISILAPIACALAAAGCVGVHAGLQSGQRRLFERMLRGQRSGDASLSGVGSVALPALREAQPKEARARSAHDHERSAKGRSPR